MRGLLLSLACIAACGGEVHGPVEGGTTDSTAPDGSGLLEASLPDSGPITSECQAAGGSFCTGNHWVICPAGFEPVLPFGSYECGQSGDTGWCCKRAPNAPCNATGANNCLDSCGHSCWAPAMPDMACENGRVCCSYICD